MILVNIIKETQDVYMELESADMKEYKIIFAGLDNAGKTSFLLALRKKYNFYELIKKLKPTIMIDYNSFNFLADSRISIWDMGGQKLYREKFVKNTIYFEETDSLYYIIDVQDEEKYDTSISYLETLLSLFKGLEYSSEVIICLNKLDPEIREEKKVKNNIETLKKRVIELDSSFNYKFFETSIYNIASLSKAISYSLNKQLNLNPLHKKIEELIQNFKLNHAIIYTEYGLILSDYYDKPIDTTEFEDSIFEQIKNNMIFIHKIYHSRLEFTDVFFDNYPTAEYLKKIKVSTSAGEILVYITISGEVIDRSALADSLKGIKETLEEILA